jgi:hypothetical protein
MEKITINRGSESEKDHPELQSGESFIMNVTQQEFDSFVKLQNEEKSNLCSGNKLRLGNIAYQTNSNTPVDPSLNFRPMFVKIVKE